MALVVLGLAAIVMLSGTASADAPDDWENATTVKLTELHKVLHGGDDWDWFRIEVPDGSYVKIKTELDEPAPVQLHLREDDGPKLGDRPAEGYTTASVDTAAIRIGFTGDIDEDDAVGYTFSYQFVDAEPQDDAGSGQDAANHWQHASPTVEPGTIDAEMLYNFKDVGDWYRMELPEDHWVKVSIPVIGVYPQLRAPDGTVIDQRADPQWDRYTRALPPGDEVLIGTEDSSGDAGADPWIDEPYTFEIETIPAPDAAVEEIRIDPVGVEEAPDTPATGVAMSQNTVHVDVANHGPGDLVEGHLNVYVSHPTDVDSERRTLYKGPIEIDPGATRTVELEWDATGEVGNATIHAEIDTLFDLDRSNQETSRQTAVLVPLAEGADAFNNGAGESLWMVPARGYAAVSTWYDNERRGVGLDTGSGTVGLFTTTQGFLDSDDEPRALFVYCIKTDYPGVGDKPRQCYGYDEGTVDDIREDPTDPPIRIPEPPIYPPGT